MSGWWLRYPEQYAREIEDLDALDGEYSINGELKEQGILEIHFTMTYEGAARTFRAIYPDSYPYFHPTVITDDEELTRHRNPLGGNLCLLANYGEQWVPGKETLVSIMRSQLPRIHNINSNPEDKEYTAENEQHVGELLSSFLNQLSTAVIGYPSWQPDPTQPFGFITLQSRRFSSIPGNLLLAHHARGFVRKFMDANRNTLHELDLPHDVDKLWAEQRQGIWVRLSEKPDISQARNIHQYVMDLVQGNPDTARMFEKLKIKKVGTPFVLGIGYPDEAHWQTEGWDWVFVSGMMTKRGKRSQSHRYNLVTIRGEAIDKATLMERTPELHPLDGKRILIVGLGSIGSPIALQMARGGVSHIDVVDSDHLQYGNTVRWAAGWAAAGYQKTDAISALITNNYPYTTISGLSMRIGSAPIAGKPESFDGEAIETAIGKADLVIDASASQRIHDYIADLCRAYETSYLWASATHGCHGGLVGRVIPGTDKGCYTCVQRHMADGAITPPPQDPDSTLQAAGCSEETFTGAGIDADVISNQAVRLALATLCRDTEDSYPDFDWNFATCALRDGKGNAIAPKWTAYPLVPHNGCACQK